MKDHNEKKLKAVDDHADILRGILNHGEDQATTGSTGYVSWHFLAGWVKGLDKILKDEK